MGGRIVGIVETAEIACGRTNSREMSLATRVIASDLEKYLHGIADLATTDLDLSFSAGSSVESPVDQYRSAIDAAKRAITAAAGQSSCPFNRLAWEVKGELSELRKEAESFVDPE